MKDPLRKKAVCNSCTVRLVEAAYRRAPWFRLVREPLKWGMKAMAVMLRIDPVQYEVKAPDCRGCMRFYKLTLKEESGAFRMLNAVLNPVFDRLIAILVTPEEMREAKDVAKQAMIREGGNHSDERSRSSGIK